MVFAASSSSVDIISGKQELNPVFFRRRPFRLPASFTINETRDRRIASRSCEQHIGGGGGGIEGVSAWRAERRFLSGCRNGLSAIRPSSSSSSSSLSIRELFVGDVTHRASPNTHQHTHLHTRWGQPGNDLESFRMNDHADRTTSSGV